MNDRIDNMRIGRNENGDNFWKVIFYCRRNGKHTSGFREEMPRKREKYQGVVEYSCQ